MPRRVFYLGRWINHSGWYPDRKIRLYDRSHCRWEGDFVHERLEVHGASGKFNGDLLHFPYRDWKDHVAESNVTPNWQQKLRDRRDAGATF